MRQRLMAFIVPMLLVAGARAGDLNIHIILSGEVAPGIYGQVQIGNGPQPPLVYAQPMLIQPQVVYPPPVYLHVPPGHAKHWGKHCHEYNACNRPVYFVRSAEYEPGYESRDHGDEHGHGHGNKHDHEHEHEHERKDDK